MTGLCSVCEHPASSGNHLFDELFAACFGVRLPRLRCEAELDDDAGADLSIMTCGCRAEFHHA